MDVILCLMLFLGTNQQPRADGVSEWIRVTIAGEAAQFRPDGTGRTDLGAAKDAPDTRATPDGKVVIAYADGTLQQVGPDGVRRRVSPDGLRVGYWDLAADGKQVAFGARAADDAPYQVHLLDLDDGRCRALTAAPHGADEPRFAPDGRLAYLVQHQRRGKSVPVDLVIRDPRDDTAKPIVVVENIPISDHAWSPDGKTIVYGVVGAAVFHDVATGKSRRLPFETIDRSMNNFAAVLFAWAPDGRAVACRLIFWGGRQANGPKMFGDEELFILPRDEKGKVTWFVVGEHPHRIEWVREPAAR